MRSYLDKVKLLQKIAIINPQGKILALQRNPEAYSRPGAWDLPGGNIDEKDRISFKQGTNIALSTIHREVVEETGLKVEDVRIIYVDAIVNQDQALAFLTGYQGKIENQEVLISKEHRAYKWVTREEFMSLDVGEGGEFLKKIVGKVVSSRY